MSANNKNNIYDDYFIYVYTFTNQRARKTAVGDSLHLL
jgi:hypothetical protein